ncbi:MAG: hypothetical protein JXJ18_06030 [Rhodobacteraceae bacterium]|nr:hypothetical protein [Paracoccaceae bacterium]
MRVVLLDSAPYLIAGSRAEAGLSLLSLAPGALAVVADQLGPSWNRGTYGLSDLCAITVDGQAFILPAGTMDDAPALLPVSAAGFGSAISYMGQGLPPQLQSLSAIETTTGTFVYYTQWGTAGLGAMALDGDLGLNVVAHVDDDADRGLDAITALASAAIGTRDFVFALSGSENTVTSLRIGAEGDLRIVDSITPDEGLWVSAPSVMEQVVAGGNTYLIVGAVESASLSVIEVVPWGGMTVTDHLVDTLDTRFDNISALATLKVNHRILVFAGGSDDGISAMELAPSGRLYPLATVADTNQSTFQNVTSITATEIDGEIQVFAAGEDEAGITQFTLDLDNFGVLRRGSTDAEWLNGIWADDLLDGFEGDDVLRGNVGNDRLIDGEGRDILFGGRGDDIFVFIQDGDLDIARDFKPGEDQIDLSDLDMLYSFDQLTIEQRSYGVVVEYGGEALRVESEFGVLEVTDLSPDDFIF